MTKIYSTITSVLLTIVTALLIVFPSSTNLKSFQQNLLFPGRDAIAYTVVTAIKEKDADAIVALMSEDMKSTIDKEDPADRTATFISQFKGEIIEVEYDGCSGGSKSNYGYAYTDWCWSYTIHTTEETYLLDIGWISVDTLEPENVGLSDLVLGTGENNFEYERVMTLRVYE